MSIRAPILALLVALASVVGPSAAGPVFAAALPAPAMTEPHAVSGVIRSLSGSQLMLQLRTGRLVRVDASPALRNHESAVLIVSHPVLVRGSYDAAGVLHAQTILRAKGSPSLWQADR